MDAADPTLDFYAFDDAGLRGEAQPWIRQVDDARPWLLERVLLGDGVLEHLAVVGRKLEGDLEEGHS